MVESTPFRVVVVPVARYKIYEDSENPCFMQVSSSESILWMIMVHGVPGTGVPSMSRSIWSGTIQFGLVSVPVQLVTAVKEKTMSFHMMTPDGACRLRRKLVCPETGKEYDFKDTARGIEIAPDEYVLVDQKEVRKLKPEAGKTIDILDFVQLQQIDPVYFNHTYYLRPGQGAAKAFGLLVRAMEKTKRAAIATFVLRDRQHLVTLRPADSIIVLHTMFYADEVLPTSEAAPDTKAAKTSAQELAIAEQLIGALAGDFDPSKYHDDYREKVEELVHAKSEDKPIHVHSEPHRERIVNLMDALKKSLETIERPVARNGHRKHLTRRRRKVA